MRFFSSFLITLLIPLVAVMPIQAEQTQAVPGQPSLLKIRLDDGSKTSVEANSVSSGYSVQITDAAGKPVSDAAVAIHLPEEGASGVFANGEHAVVIYTDSSGVAKFPQVNWGSTTGSLSFRVTAVKGEMHAGTLIEQTVLAPSAKTPSSAPVAAFPSAEPAAKLVTPAAPGVPVSVAAVTPQAMPSESTPQASPPTPPTPQTAPAAKPANPDSVSVVNTSGSKAGGGISKKWVIIGVALAAVGLGAALALAGGKSNSSTASTTGTTIGSPTVNVGH